MKLVVLLETDAARDRFLAYAADVLPAGERIVRATELRGETSLVLLFPTDAGAELVARETPMVVPGGYTQLVSYYRVRDAGGLEVKLRAQGPEERREVVLASATA